MAPKLAPSVINLSSVTIPEAEIQLLQRGRKFALPPVDQLESILLSEFATGVRGDTRLNTEKVRRLIEESINQLDAPLSPDLRSYFSLKRRLVRENVVLVKADKAFKSNITVFNSMVRSAIKNSDHVIAGSGNFIFSK